MPELVVREGSGPARAVPLTKTQPVMIGSLEFNEIVVPGDNIPAVVCRVSWSGSGFEITVAGAPSVSVNGRNVSRAELSTGDVIAIGSLVIRYGDGAVPNNQAMPGKASEKPNATASKSPPRKSPTPQPVIIEELSASFSDLPSLPTREASGSPASPRAWTNPSKPRGNASPGNQSPFGSEVSLKGSRKIRPGEEDLIRSPFVLGMSIAVGLLIVGGIVTLFLIQQRSLEREFGLAEVEFTEGRFAQAYERFHKFVTDHPGAKRTAEARRFAWKSSIERELVGASPAYAQALDQLQKWILDDRDSLDFKEIRPDLQRAAERIATGGAIEAAARADTQLLGISDEATRLVERYTEDRTELTASISRIEQLRLAATRSIAKRQALEATLASMKASLGRGDSLGALAAHRQLLGRFPDLRKSVDLGKLVEEALVVEKDRVAPGSAQFPEVKTPPGPVLSVLPYHRQRSRVDEAGSPTNLPVRLAATIAAIDIENGSIQWQYPLGGPSGSRFVRDIPGAAERWLVYSEREQGLLLIDARSGQPLWICPTGELADGTPCLVENSLFVSRKEGEVWRVDLETGRPNARLKFPQQLSTQPVLLRDEAHLVVGGEQSLLYTFARQPLQIVATTYTGHEKQTLTVPQLATGELLLVGENDQLDSGKLHVFGTENPAQSLPSRQVLNLPGLLTSDGRIRGSKFVTPLIGERLAVFNVTDQSGLEPLGSAGGYPVRSNYAGPVSLWMSPADEVWMQGSTLKRFAISADGVSLISGNTFPGWTAGPMIATDRQVLISRRPVWTNGVICGTADLQCRAGAWRTTLGGRLLAHSTIGNRLLTAGDAGLLTAWTADRISGLPPATTGSESRSPLAKTHLPTIESAISVDLPTLEEWRLMATGLPGRIVLAATKRANSGSKQGITRIWQYDGTGTSLPFREIGGFLEQPPIPLEKGVVLLQSDGALFLDLQSNQKSRVTLPPPDESGDGQMIPGWKGAARFPNSIVAATSGGELWRLVVSQGELTRVGTAQLAQEDVHSLVASGRFVACLHKKGEVSLHAEATLDPTGNIPTSDVVQSLLADDESILLWSGSHVENWSTGTLGNRDASPSTQAGTWKLPRDPRAAPVAHFDGSTIWIVTGPGQVAQVERGSGKILQTYTTQIEIDALLAANGKLLAASKDQAIEQVAELRGVASAPTTTPTSPGEPVSPEVVAP